MNHTALTSKYKTDVGGGNSRLILFELKPCLANKFPNSEQKTSATYDDFETKKFRGTGVGAPKIAGKRFLLLLSSKSTRSGTSANGKHIETQFFGIHP